MCLRTKAEAYDDCTATTHMLARVFHEAHKVGENMCGSETFSDENVERAEYTERLYDTPRVTVWLKDMPPCVKERMALQSGAKLVVRPY